MCILSCDEIMCKMDARFARPYARCISYPQRPSSQPSSASSSFATFINRLSRYDCMQVQLMSR